jgi:hypothetical protein
LIDTHHPNVFYAVNDVHDACDGIFPTPKERLGVFPFPVGKLMRSMMAAEQPELSGHRYGCSDAAAE